MAGMRVHELAKEFGMSSKDMLDRLQDMKIPVKSHASVLSDANVEKARKALAAEVAPVQDEQGDAPATPQQTAAQAEEAEKKAHEEAARRAAVEKERAARQAERQRREKKRAEHADQAGEPAKEALKRAPHTSQFAGLESQIEQERQRVARERAHAQQVARAHAAARDVAKKRAVEENLNAAKHRKSGGSASAPHEVKHIPTHRSSFDSLLSQIEHERTRLNEQKQQQAAARQNERKGTKKKGKHPHSFEPDVPELDRAASGEAGEDRYSQMADHAEKLQRDKVLAEARAAGPPRARARAKAAARSARRSARPRPASAPRSARSRRASTRIWCWTSPRSRCRRAPRSASSPS